MTTQNTPTPWKQNTHKKCTIHSVIGENTYRVANTDLGLRPNLECEANAAFIVKAVNTYDELVELLLMALPYVEDGQQFEKPSLVGRNVKKIRRALAKAGIK